MKLLIVHPGAEWSVTDVHSGLKWGLQPYEGVHQDQYNLHVRLDRSRRWLVQQYRAAKKATTRQLDLPTFADVCRHASEGALSRALWIEADWVLIISGMYLHPDIALMMRRAGLKLATVLTESPYEDDGQQLIAALSQVVFTNERTSVPLLQAKLPRSKVIYLPPAYRPDLHGPDAPNVGSRHHQVVFVGTPWKERLAMWRQMDWRGIDFGVYGTFKPGDLPKRKHLCGNITPPDVTSALYRNAQVGLNYHRAHPTAESMNIRCYELAAAGACFVSDARPELTELLGDAVPTFSTAEELEALLRSLLASPARRAELSAEVMDRIRPQTWRQRADIVYDALGGGRL